jgi:hypothetical protein
MDIVNRRVEDGVDGRLVGDTRPARGSTVTARIAEVNLGKRRMKFVTRLQTAREPSWSRRLSSYRNYPQIRCISPARRVLSLDSNTCSQRSKPTASASSLIANDPCTPRAYANHTIVSSYELEHCGRWALDDRFERIASSRGPTNSRRHGGSVQVITTS